MSVFALAQLNTYQLLHTKDGTTVRGIGNSQSSGLGWKDERVIGIGFIVPYFRLGSFKRSYGAKKALKRRPDFGVFMDGRKNGSS